MDTLPGNIDLNKITPREREILDHVLTGKTSKQIARVLKISPRTVEIHRTNILRRWGVTSTPQIVNAILRSAKELEHQLSKEQSHLLEAQKIAHLGSWVFDLTTKNIIWSDEMYRLYGFTSDSYKPTIDSIFEYIEESDREKIKKELQAAINENRNYSVEYKIKLNDGKSRYINSNGVLHFDENNNPIYMTGISQDITHHYDNRAIYNLRYQALLNTFNDILFIVNQDWSELKEIINGNIFLDLSVTNDKWINTYIYSEDLESFNITLQESVKNKKMFELKHRIMTKEGMIVWKKTRSVPIFNTENEIVEWIGICNDLGRNESINSK